MSERTGFYKGRHYSTYVEEMKALKRAGDYVGAEALLLDLMAAAENEARVQRCVVAPAYYQQLAIIYRKTNQPEKEVAVIERHIANWKRDVGIPLDLTLALDKARKRLAAKTA